MMDTAEALWQLGVRGDHFTAEQQEKWTAEGYFIVPEYFTQDELVALRRAYDQCAEDLIVLDDLPIEPGGEFISDLFNKSAAFLMCLNCRPMLAAAHQLMGELRVSSLNGRNPRRGRGLQALHSDAPRLHASDWRRVNTLIVLDDMSEANGGTRLIPGSHTWPALNVSEYNMGDAGHLALTAEERALIPADPTEPHPHEIVVHATAGSICVINAHVWHGGTVNRTGAPRRVLHMALGRRDVPPQEDQRRGLSPELTDRANGAERYLLDLDA